MKLLINKDNNGAQELQDLTGSYYANNDFTRIRTDWILAQEEIQKLVGKEVLERALDHYYSAEFPVEDTGSGSGESGIDTELVYHLQIPISYKATFRYYQSNIVSHEDAGRKLKIDNQNEKLPWEWMLDRDDLAQVRKANETTDRLIRFLEDNQIQEWLDSEQRQLTRTLFVNTVAVFHDAYPIDMSPRFFYTVTPFISEVQNRQIKKALGTEYSNLLAYWQNFNSLEGSGSAGSGLPGEPEQDEFYENLLLLVQKVMPLLTMVMATRRLSLQVLPDGVVQVFRSMLQTANSSQAALPEVIHNYCDMLNEDARYALDDIKRLLNENDPEALDYPLLPENSKCNKFFRT